MSSESANQDAHSPGGEPFSELADLWARRAKLSEREWSRLFQLVMAVLRANPVREERDPQLGGAGAVEALRQSFFVDKVLLPATAPGADPNPHLTMRALPVFYKRYLIDQIRANQRHPTLELPENEKAPNPASNQDDRFGCFSAVKESEEDLHIWESADAARLQRSAREFLNEQEDWVVLYLALHFCHGRERLALSKLQHIYRIPSYHYKARQLGITPPRGGYANLAEFSETIIGQWLTDNDIPLQTEHLSIIRHAFDRLCLEAFAEFERRELPGWEMEP